MTSVGSEEGRGGCHGPARRTADGKRCVATAARSCSVSALFDARAAVTGDEPVRATRSTLAWLGFHHLGRGTSVTEMVGRIIVPSALYHDIECAYSECIWPQHTCQQLMFLHPLDPYTNVKILIKNKKKLRASKSKRLIKNVTYCQKSRNCESGHSLTL